MLDFVSSGLQKIQQCRQQTPISRFRPSGETPLRHIQEGKITVATSRIWETHPPLSQALRHPVGHRDAHQHAQHDIFQVHRQQIVLFYSRKSNRTKNIYGKSYFSICDFFFNQVIDEIERILRVVGSKDPPPRTHELLQELRDISSMAMEYFDEQILPNLKLQMDQHTTNCKWHVCFNLISLLMFKFPFSDILRTTESF